MANELQQVIEHSTRQVTGFLADKQKTGEFLPDMSIPRDIEQDIQEFLERSDKTGCILIGPPGIGKTYVVCRILQRYRDAEYPVLAYGRGRELAGETEDLAKGIADLIARDLGFDPDLALLDQLVRLNAELKSQGKFLLIVMDSIEKPISADPNVGLQQLLRGLDRLVAIWAERHLRIKLLITCVHTVWDFFPSQSLITWPHYFTRVLDKALSLSALNDQEFRAAFSKYIGPIPAGDDRSFKEIQRICEGDPFVLRLLSDPKLKALTLKGNVTIADVFDSYYNERILGRSLGPQKERFLLLLFIPWLIRMGQEDIPVTLARELHLQAYQALFTDGILRLNHQQDTVQLLHTRLTEFLIGKYLEREYPAGRMDQATLSELIRKGGRGFHALWDATAGYLARWGTPDCFLKMAQSGDYQQQEMIVDALEVAAKSQTRPTGNVSVTLSALLRDETRPARATGLRLAARLRMSDRGQIGERQLEEVFDEVLNWVKQAPRTAAEHVYLSWREFKDTRLGDGIWDDLDRFIEKNLDKFMAEAGLLARLPGWRLLVWVADKSETFRQRLVPSQKRNESHKALIEFALSVAWHILINEYNDITIQRISKLWSSIPPRARRSLKLWVAYKRAERARPDLTRERVTHFLDQTLAEKPPYFPPEGPFLAEFLDPGTEIAKTPAAEETIFKLLNAGQIATVALTALALSQQAHRDFSATEPLLRRLFERCGPMPQLALLAGFALHAEHTIPEGLIPTLEQFTRTLAIARPDYLTNPMDPWGKLKKYSLPIVLAPLGLTWCNSPQARGSLHIEPIVRMAADLGWSRDPELFRGAVESLVPVGIHFPEPVLHTLLEMGAFEDPNAEAWLGKALAMIQTFNGERVDRFLRSQRLDIRPAPLTAAEVSKLLIFFYWLSTSNFMYYSLSVDNLRMLWASAIRALANDPPPSKDEVAQRFGVAVDRLLQEKEFQLDRILNKPVKDPQVYVDLIMGLPHRRS